MSYLRTSVHGEVKKMIAGFPLTAAAYEMTWNLIQERYGRPARVAMRHISALLNLEFPKSGSEHTYVESLYKLYNEITLHVRCPRKYYNVSQQGIAVLPCRDLFITHTYVNFYSSYRPNKTTHLILVKFSLHLPGCCTPPTDTLIRCWSSLRYWTPFSSYSCCSIPNLGGFISFFQILVAFL